MTVHRVCSSTELPPGARTRLTVGGREIVVMNIGGRYHAMRNRCAHQGGPIAEGAITCAVRASKESAWHAESVDRDGVIRCPWHALEYDLASGRALGGWNWRVKVYPVQLRAGYVEVVI